MKKVSILGILVEASDWILHPIAYHKELMEYREDYDKEVLNFHKEIERLNSKLESQKVAYYQLDEKTRLKILEKEEIIKELNYKILDLEFVIENDLETIYKVRGKIGGITKQSNKLKRENLELKEKLIETSQKLVNVNNDLIKANARIKVLSSKSPREKINYTLLANEKMKRSKKNE